MTPTTIDTTPRAMAATLDSLAQPLLDHDREAARILITAREGLRALGYNRWAAQINWRSERRAMRRALKRRHTAGRRCAMREALAPLQGRRIAVHGVYRRTGWAPLATRGYRRHALFVGVATPAGTPLADHLWVLQGRALAALNLKPGALVASRGTVVAYERGDGSRDYKLANVRAAMRVEAPPLRTGMEPDVLAALRARAVACDFAAGKARESLTHIQHVAYPTGGKPVGGNWYASLLEARGRVGEIQATMGEVQSLIDRLGTRPAEVQA
jgi:hypothetical protein